MIFSKIKKKQQMNSTKNWVFEKTNKTDKPLGNSIKVKSKRKEV